MKLVFALFFIAVVTAQAADSAISDDIQREWHEYKKEYGKSYDEAEDKQRLKNYLENKKKIENYNARHARGEVTKQHSINHFSDMTFEEFSNKYVNGERILTDETNE